MPQDRAPRPHPPPPGVGSDPSGGGPPQSGSGFVPDSNTNSSIAGTYFLGRYRVVDEIGIGGMASVHLARMDGPGGFQKWVAIKRIHPHLVEDDSFVHMFLDEARIAARISHPNVASVFELGKHEDTYWIAMEYLHGEPLREVMRRTEEMGQPMPPEIACRVIADAAEGLHAAHELLGKNGEKLGLVHRDVTPHNLFVTYDGTTKVVDFGIAKFSSRMASTRAGTLKGKLAYMSPEQVAGETIDRRTDLFALGVVLWELTTGQRLFRMDSDLDTLAKVQECNVPRPTQVVRGYPIDLEKIVMKALAKNKNERYKTAREFSRALQSLLMRRGLFIASDEVASYVQSIFQDRIRKREAHLRWAAEVTQTINLDSKVDAQQSWNGGNGQEPSLVTYNSDVQGTGRPAPRPAAGLPVSADPRAAAHTFSGPSATTNPRPGAQAETVRPPHRPPAPSAASAAMPPPPPPSLQRPSTVRDPIPAPMPPLNVTQATAAAAPKAKANEPASRAPMPPHPSVDEPPTIRASPKAREEMLQMALAAATTGPPQSYSQPRASAPPAPPIVPTQVVSLDDGDEYDDTDDTIVTATRPDFGAAAAPSSDARPAPLPAAGRPPPSTRAGEAAFVPPRPAPPRVSAPPPLPAVVVPPAIAEIERGPESPLDQTHTAIGESPFFPSRDGTGRSPTPLLQRSGSMSGELPDPLATARSHAQLEVQRMFAPPPSRSEQRTVIAQHLRRMNIPLWAVAAASGALALLAFLLFLFIFSHVGGRSDVTPAPTASAASTPSPDPSATPNPFSGARDAFAIAAGAGGTSMTAPNEDSTVVMANVGGDTAAPSGDDGTPSATTAAPKPRPPPTTTAAAATTKPTDDAKDPAGQAFGTLTVVCYPACDSVLDNGSSLGPSPIFKRKSAVGPRRVTLQWGKGHQKVLSAIVVADQDARVQASWP